MTTSQSSEEVFPENSSDHSNVGFESRLDKLCAAIALIAESVQELKNVTAEQGKIIEKALQLAANQQTGMDKFVDAFYEQAKSVTELLLSLKESTEAARHLAKAGESSQAIAKSHQEAIRDLLQELRQSRNN
jgi:methyl-accepting chemotaxis protein